MIIASQLPAWLLPVTQWMLIQVIVGLVATFTPSRSRVRDAALVTAVALAYSVQCVVDKAFPSAKVAGLIAALCWANIFNAVDILLLSRVTYFEQLDWERERPKERLKQSSAISSSEVGFSWRKLAWALELPFNLRRVDTPWQINKLPMFQSGNHQYTPSRLEFLRDRGLMLCLALLAMGFLHRRENDQELLGMISFEKESILNQVMQISTRAVLSQASLVVSYWINMRAGHQLIYSFCSFISVALGIYEPASWPPLGGSILDAWSLRQFWGCTWHQGFRKLLGSNAEFITFSLLRIPRGTLWARYSCLMLVFLISGVIHVMMDLARAIPVADSGSMPFFTFQALGIMAEDFIIYIGSMLVGGHDVWWKRMVGYVWVAVFMFFSTPMYSYPICRGLYYGGERVPSFYV